MSGEVSARTLPSGPWDQAFLVDVPLRLASKSNARRFRQGSRRPPGFSSFEESLAAQVRAVRPSGWLLGDATAALGSRPAVAAVILARSPIDAGNFPKSVLDALEGVLYHNDASVLSLSCLAQRGRSGSPTFRVGFARLPPSPTPVLLTAAATGLLTLAVDRWDPDGEGA